MKLKTTILIATLATCHLSFAGNDEYRTPPKADRGERIAEKLNLNDDQQAQFTLVMKNKREKIQAAMDVIHEETKAELATFLNEEQLQKLEQRMQRRHQMRVHKKEHKQMRKHHAPKD